MGWDPLVLEEVVGRAPAVRMSEAQLSALADELAGMRQAAETQNLHAQLLHDVRFHEIINASTRQQLTGIAEHGP